MQRVEHFTVVFYLDKLFAYFSSVYLAIIEYHWPVYAYMYTWNWDKNFSTMMKESRNVFTEHCQGVTFWPFVT